MAPAICNAPKIIAAAGVLIILASLLVSDWEAAGTIGVIMAILGAATNRDYQGVHHGSNHHQRSAGY